MSPQNLRGIYVSTGFHRATARVTTAAAAAAAYRSRHLSYTLELEQAFLDLRRFEEAEKDATMALESDPDNLKASYRRGRARFFRENPDKRGACMDLTRVVSKDPNNDQASSG